jgi:hypothetical protein
MKRTTRRNVLVWAALFAGALGTGPTVAEFAIRDEIKGKQSIIRTVDDILGHKNLNGSYDNYRAKRFREILYSEIRNMDTANVSNELPEDRLMWYLTLDRAEQKHSRSYKSLYLGIIRTLAALKTEKAAECLVDIIYTNDFGKEASEEASSHFYGHHYFHNSEISYEMTKFLKGRPDLLAKLTKIIESLEHGYNERTMMHILMAIGKTEYAKALPTITKMAKSNSQDALFALTHYPTKDNIDIVIDGAYNFTSYNTDVSAMLADRAIKMGKEIDKRRRYENHYMREYACGKLDNLRSEYRWGIFHRNDCTGYEVR